MDVMMLIISLHNGHDASVSVIRDGNIEYHCELERTMGVKHYAGQHNNNVVIDFLFVYVLPKLGIKIFDVDVLCLSSQHAGWVGKMWKDTELVSIIGDRDYNRYDTLFLEWSSKWRKGHNLKFFTSLHHLNHMAYAYYTSPFDEALIFAYDGEGDFNMSTSYGVGYGNKIDKVSDIRDNQFGLRSNRIGLMYSKLNFILPFLGDNDMATPGKAMGLSSYGEPNDRWRNCIRKCLVEGLPNKMADEIKLPNDPNAKIVQDFLATFQDECERYVTETIEILLDKFNCNNLVISGGCGLNVSINSKLNSIVDNLYIPPACSDVGQSLGSGLLYWHHVLDNKFEGMDWHNPYLGDYLWNKEYIEMCKGDIGCKSYKTDDDLVEAVAQLLVDGKITAWAQGRSEIGPRALGNRSILCRPYPSEMKDIINAKVKHREWWRPFAPVCLVERYKDWFEIDHEQPYMMESPNVVESKRSIIPAVTHVDGTARVQTVSRQQNELLHKLLFAFEKKTGIPILLNTSLNDRGQPIVNNVKDIIDLLKNTDLDCAVIDRSVYYKRKMF